MAMPRSDDRGAHLSISLVSDAAEGLLGVRGWDGNGLSALRLAVPSRLRCLPGLNNGRAVVSSQCGYLQYRQLKRHRRANTRTALICSLGLSRSNCGARSFAALIPRKQEVPLMLKAFGRRQNRGEGVARESRM
jgi:hypothetical protein